MECNLSDGWQTTPAVRAVNNTMACGKRVGVGTAVTRQALRRAASACGNLEPGLVTRAVGSGEGRSCKAVHARPPAVVLAGRGHGVTAAREDGAHTQAGVHWLIIHVELEVSAPFECGAMRCASDVAHREMVHTLGSDSFCVGWFIPGTQATSHGAAAAGPYQLAEGELRGLRGDHRKQDNACSAHCDAWSLQPYNNAPRRRPHGLVRRGKNSVATTATLAAPVACCRIWPPGLLQLGRVLQAWGRKLSSRVSMQNSGLSRE